VWHRALDIPGAMAIVDVEGIEARRFGAKTSGLTLLYDPNRQLAFQGGITEGRGHEGDNAGSSLLLARLNGTANGLGRADTFGCPLFGDSSDCEEGGTRCTP
jgi:hypothetical protein